MRLTSVFIFMGLTLLTSSASLADALCVKSSKANLRAGPGQQFRITWTVGQHMPLKKIGSRGAWVHVEDLDGEKHWISASMVGDNLSCAVVKTRLAALRQGPGQRFLSAEYGAAEKYTPFKKINREQAWVQVQDEYGGKFWVHEKNLWMPTTRMRIEF